MLRSKYINKIIEPMVKKHKACLLTGSKDLYPLKNYESNYLVKSKSSGFVFCEKIPSEEELISHYNSYPIGYNHDSLVTRKRIHTFLDGVEKYRKTNRILDVGCGPGLFLIEAKKRGWEVYATEYSERQIAYLSEQGIQAKKGKLNNNLFENEAFDVVISSEVIEHINNPLEEMQQFYRLLRKGGLVYITTPNFNAFERLWFKNHWEIIEYPEHLCYYTPKTIHLLLSKSGFVKLKITTTGISLDRIKRAKAKKNNSDLNVSCSDEKLRVQLDTGYKKWIKAWLNYILNLFGIGNSLKVWYEKR
jgi:2-polyprenyl-3-methyl-5-hydroxy-6-metoxy-1,4-benzoquinol methylase